MIGGRRYLGEGGYQGEEGNKADRARRVGVSAAQAICTAGIGN